MDVIPGAREVAGCRVCGATDWQEVLSLGLVPLANRFLDPASSHGDEPYFPLRVLSCRACRLMSLDHVVDPEILYRDYLYITPESETIRRHMRNVVDLFCERFGPEAGDLVVEMGSNIGGQLRLFAGKGMRVVGVDPARNLADVAEANGIPTVPEFFSVDTAAAVRDSHGAAKLLLGRHVFAHIDDLAGVLDGVERLLVPDGVFAVEVPYVLDMLATTAFDTIYHEHLSYFSVGTLSVLAERHGMRIVDVARSSVHGGSVLVFMARRGSKWRSTAAVERLRGLEHDFGLYGDRVYRRFAEDVMRVCEELPRIVRGIATEGGTVAGYGAPAKGNTILNVCGLGRDVVAFCSDTTPLKQGKLLPGTHVPVCSPQEARLRGPDHYLLLAWNYAEEILRKESGFLAGGGRFILPIPRPVLVDSAEEAVEALQSAVQL